MERAIKMNVIFIKSINNLSQCKQTSSAKFKLYTTDMSLSADDTLDLLKDFLPEIEQELRNQIEPDLEEQYRFLLAQEIQQIEIQARQQFQQALQTLRSEFNQLKSEKEHDLEIQLVRQQQSFHEKDRMRLEKAQERFLQDHFDDRIMQHPLMINLQLSLEQEVTELMLSKYQTLKEKRVKEMRVRLQNREQKERTEMDKAIKAQIYSQSGLEQLRAEIHKFKISLASMKSKYNIKITKINSEIKELSKKCQNIQYANSDLLIEELEKEISQIHLKIDKSRNSPADMSIDSINQSSMIGFRPNCNFTLGQNVKSFNQGHAQLYSLDANFINQEIDIESSSDSDSDSLNKDNKNEEDTIPCPPNSKVQSLNQHQREEDQARKKTEEFDLDVPVSIQPLLMFDVAKMLRQQWQEDAFDRFLCQREDKENDSLTANQSPNNFQALYSAHLKKLNRTKLPKSKPKRLTERAKQQIMINFSSQREKAQFYSD